MKRKKCEQMKNRKVVRLIKLMNDDGDGDCKDLLEDEEKKKRKNK